MSTAFHQKDNITERKRKHLEVCIDPESRIEGSSAMFDQIEFVHNPLPELSFGDISLSDSFLGKEVGAPFFISSMTGGSDGGFRANKNLVKAAEIIKIPVGLGSLRVLFYHPELKEHFAMRSFGPDIPIFGNLSAVQLNQHPIDAIIELVNSLELDALAVHLNPGQELFQEGGDHDFSGLLPRIEALASKLTVIVKETGFGIPPAAVEKLLNAGARYVDIAGAGGTNWICVEQLTDPSAESTGTFSDWGVPTAVNLASLSADVFNGKILASGGLRSPLDFAKSIALGACSAGTALPLIRLENESGVEGIVGYWKRIQEDVKKIMVLTGVRDTNALRGVPLVLSSRIIHYAKQLRRNADWRRNIAG